MKQNNLGENDPAVLGDIQPTLANLPRYPESVSINSLVPVKGTVLGDMFDGAKLIDDIESVCTVAVSRASLCRGRWCACPPAAKA